jgi:transcriptional regulator with XRE-family HTH domain
MAEINWQFIADRLHMARRHHNLTQQDLAQVVGTGRTTIYRLEKGNKPNVSFAVMVRVADALHLSLDYLLGRKPTH